MNADMTEEDERKVGYFFFFKFRVKGDIGFSSFKNSIFLLNFYFLGFEWDLNRG